MVITPPLMGTSPQKATNRDFGQIKVRKMNVNQAQANGPLDQNSSISSSFNRLNHPQIFQIVEESTDIAKKRALSRWYYDRNGLYARAVRYIADLYKFDFELYPNLNLDDELEEKKQKEIRKKWNMVLEYFDSSPIQYNAREWAIQVCIEGCYYGYICDDINDRMIIQDLPSDFCRSRFCHLGKPVVEFNLEYFDKISRNEEYRKKIVGLFPKEIQEGYKKYKQNKLLPEDQGDKAGWIILDTNRAFKFSFSKNDIPPFLNAIPSLLELEEVQDLEKEKLLQEIQKILVQTFDLDKNGQLPFTVPELQRLNQNAIDMVGDAVGVSVLSTVADVSLESLSPNSAKDSQDRVAQAKDDVYSAMGISTNLFNTDGNLALDKSITIDEAFVKPLVLQIEKFYNDFLEWKFNKRELKFRFKMLPTTIFNYKDISNSYKDLTKLGFSRFLPMLALGHTQKEVISLAKLEQQILQLDAYMLPPFSSNTMSSDTWSNIKDQQAVIIQGGKVGATAQNQTAKTANQISDSNSSGGRPTLPDSQKSDKTIANLASK